MVPAADPGRARRGPVINLASTAAFQPIPAMAVYDATKAFVLSFLQALWQETQGPSERVLALCPGATETGFFATAEQQPFVTRGRQTPKQAVATAPAAAGKTSPPSCPGGGTGSAPWARFPPRRIMPVIVPADGPGNPAGQPAPGQPGRHRSAADRPYQPDEEKGDGATLDDSRADGARRHAGITLQP